MYTCTCMGVCTVYCINMELLTHLYCEICDIKSTSDEQHRSHLLGKRHWSNQRSRDETQRSIFVRGFPSDTPKKEIQDIFSLFGAIHKTVIGPKNKFAIIEYANLDDALKVLNYTEPILLGECPLVVRNRDFKLLKKPVKTSLQLEGGTSAAMEEEKSFEKEESHVNTLYTKFNLSHDAIESIKSHSSLEDQIKLLVSCIRMSPSTQQSYIELLSRLKEYFTSVFPSCHVMPFGSIVTGLATPTSDMDVTLITEWTENDSKYLTSDILQHQPDSRPGCYGDVMEEDMETSKPHPLPHSVPVPPIADSLTAFSLPPNIKFAGCHDMKGCSREYKEALRVIGGTRTFVKILAIPTARCPIIRFTDTLTGITCDVSVNNRLGLYNSKLIKSYISFEPRLIPMMLILRMWIHLFASVRISNYALTVMMIHCLQRLVPRVLPSLQCNGPWPRNMEWFSTKGFTHEEMMSLLVEEWRFQLTDHESLLPSQNQLTIGELLHSFFLYYSSFPFDTHAITIHTSPDITLTKKDTCNDDYNFKITSLTVQDPLELSHNVAKNVSYRSLDILVNAMASSCVTMETILHSQDDNIFNLFANLSPSLIQSPSKVAKTHQTICFSLDNILKLFRKIPPLSELSVTIQNIIDISSRYVREKLAILVLKSLVSILENHLGFHCIPIASDVTNFVQTTQVTPITMHQQQATPITMQQQATPITMQQQSTLIQTSSLTIPSPSVHDTSSTTTQLNNTSSQLSPNGSRYESSESTVQPLIKRQREIHDEEERESVSDCLEKKVKLNGSQQSVIGLLESHCIAGGIAPSTVQCTANINTWTNRRRNRRQQGVVQATSTPNDPPILQFIMSVVDSYVKDSSSGVVSIQLFVTEDNLLFVEQFQTFFAYFKKSVII